MESTKNNLPGRCKVCAYYFQCTCQGSFENSHNVSKHIEKLDLFHLKSNSFTHIKGINDKAGDNICIPYCINTPNSMLIKYGTMVITNMNKSTHPIPKDMRLETLQNRDRSEENMSWTGLTLSRT